MREATDLFRTAVSFSFGAEKRITIWAQVADDDPSSVWVEVEGRFCDLAAALAMGNSVNLEQQIKECAAQTQTINISEMELEIDSSKCRPQVLTCRISRKQDSERRVVNKPR